MLCQQDVLEIRCFCVARHFGAKVCNLDLSGIWRIVMCPGTPHQHRASNHNPRLRKSRVLRSSDIFFVVCAGEKRMAVPVLACGSPHVVERLVT